MTYHNAPNELKELPQWVMWRYEDRQAPKPTKIPYCWRDGLPASVTDSNTWSPFDECVNALQYGYYDGIGFVLTENDPFAFIDLDDTNGDTELLNAQLKIYNTFDSYAERSPSGKGLHIIVRGRVAHGRRRSGIEVYSSRRYMTITGDVFRNQAVNTYNEELSNLWASFSKGPNPTQLYLGLMPQKEPDDKIIKTASSATNGRKFADLFEGRWSGYYQSQSEADFALVDIIAYYTQNKEQVKRIFLASELGKRDKAKRVDYLNWMLNRCFDRMLPPIDIDGLRNMIEEKLSQSSDAIQRNIYGTSLPTLEESSNVYTLPPGLVGELARYIFARSPRPVVEVSLAAAISVCSGIMGRAYNISGTGLNNYIFLLADTGVGKEMANTGPKRIIDLVTDRLPYAKSFIGPGEIKSSPAIIKYMAKGSNSFVAPIGEFGLKLQQMGRCNADSNLVAIRTFMLEVYAKSGEGETYLPIIYSNKDNSTESILSPNFSIMAESTPETFYRGLNEDLICEGLLPRFTGIHYTGKRPPQNKAHLTANPSQEMVEYLYNLCNNAKQLNEQNRTVPVRINEMARDTFDHFNVFCDMHMNASTASEVTRHLWNRAHLKALKLAAIVAIGCHLYDPTITDDIAMWAINIVKLDILSLIRKFESGEVGSDNDESNQLTRIAMFMRDYITRDWNSVKSYTGDGFSTLHRAKIIPYGYLQRRAFALTLFKRDRIGCTNAIKRAIRTLIERGDIVEVEKTTMAVTYKTQSTAYAVLKPDSLGI